MSLTQGEAGEIRDSFAATRRTLGATRAKELNASAAALGVGRAECLDLGDGKLAQLPFEELAAQVRAILVPFAPDVVVTFGADGASAIPTHIFLAGHAQGPGAVGHSTPGCCTPAFPPMIGCCLICWLIG